MFFNRISLCSKLFFSLMRVFLQIIYGVWRISKLEIPIVSIFGGSRIPQSDKYAQIANQIATWLDEADISVITGGGPGIMEAASCGAIKAKGGKGKSIGINVKGLNEAKNLCAEEYFELDYFFARKYLLTHFSIGFVVFPGGFGTLDELAEVLTLIQTKKLKRVPIVLIGTEFWAPFMRWVTDEALKHGTIAKKDLQLFTVTDDAYEAFCIMRDQCKIIEK